jgi:very-short-patch-repair endonuclease
MTYHKMNDKKKEETIKNLYQEQNMSFAEIANKLQTYANKIRRDAIKFKIPIRDKSEAQKLALKTGKIKHPTKGKKRTQETKEKIGNSVMDSWSNLSEKEKKKRKDKAKEQWESMTEDHKENMLKLANQAVRETSKTGSKLEKFIFNGLIKNGHKADFHKEQNLLNTKLQIDIFLPELNTAIEIDGPSHFLPVWGENSLARNIKYDNKKTGLLLGKGCVIIRVKQMHNFSVSRAKKILSKIIGYLENIKKKYPESDKRTIEIGD